MGHKEGVGVGRTDMRREGTREERTRYTKRRKKERDRWWEWRRRRYERKDEGK